MEDCLSSEFGLTKVLSTKSIPSVTLCDRCCKFSHETERHFFREEYHLDSRLSFRYPRPFSYQLHASLNALRASSTNGCHFCRLVALSLAAHPSLDDVSAEECVWLGVVATSGNRPFKTVILPSTKRVCLHEKQCLRPIDLGPLTPRHGREKIMSDARLDRNGVLPILRHLWTQSDDSTGSMASLMLATVWLSTCLNSHEACRKLAHRKKGGRPPARLLYISPESSRPRLIHTRGIPKHPIYAALSHCWGNVPTLTTTNATLKMREHGIHFHDMPQTFRDAVYVASSMGVDYLWIDSLCIIQDSEDDWFSESSRMRDIYQGAIFTIAAEVGSSSVSGCFVKRDGLATRPCNMSYKEDPPLLPVSVSMSRQYARLRPPVQPYVHLHSRAWVLQEQLLSTRTLAFGKTGISWRCASGCASESEPALPQYERQRFVSISPALADDHLAKIKLTLAYRVADHMGESSLRDWLLLVENYSARALSRASDRLIAIYSIAMAFQASFSASYVSGMWREWLWLCLLWTPVFSRPISYDSMNPKDGFIAATWCWASYSGMITYYAVLKGLRQSKAKAGLGTDGSKTLRQHPSFVIHYAMPNRLGLSCSASPVAFFQRLHGEHMFISQHAKNLVCVLDRPDNDLAKQLLLIAVAIFPDSSIVCLLVEPVKTDHKVYRRAGIAYLCSDSHSEAGQAWQSLAFEERNLVLI